MSDELFGSKKKVKKPLDLEAALEAVDSEQVPPKEDDQKDDEDDLEDFSKVKKKKKKKPFNFDDLNSACKQEDDAGDQPAEVEDADLDLTKKKKKKKKVALDLETFDVTTKGSVESSESHSIVTESNRDYTYMELLHRVFNIMAEKNPQAGEKKTFVMKPPEVVRVGTKKSSFVNFMDICKALKRTHKHLLSFLLSELGTSGSIDGNNQLIIKGRFQPKQMESVLRRYIKEYVMCHTCKSRDTVLQKSERLYFLQCNSCQSRCSVTSIKSGYQAVTTKRAQTRAKQH